MFGGWPHELADKPISYLRTLTDYYLAVKDAERKAIEGSSEDEEPSDTPGD